MAYTEEELKKELETKEYEYGFVTEIDSDTFPVGLDEEIVTSISKRKSEPKWMTDWRLKAFKAWKEMEEPDWANVGKERHIESTNRDSALINVQSKRHVYIQQTFTMSNKI